MQRIDFLGNANSYPLTIAMGMRSLGYDVHMHLLDSYYLNDPKNLYPEFASGYPEWIHDWRPLNLPFSLDEEKLEALTDNIKDADALVLNLGAVCLGYGQERPYFCLLTGTDLLTYCDESFLQHDSILAGKCAPRNVSEYLESLCKGMLVDFFRESIREANGYAFFPRALQPTGAKMLESIGAEEDRQYPLLVTDTEKLAFTDVASRSDRALRVLVAARCTWRKDIPPFLTALDYKGTDVFLRGAAQAAQNGLHLEISLFRKGVHVQQTIALIEELGLGAFCRWHDECPQHAFHQHIREHDIVVDSLDLSHIGMASADAFALGRPVIARHTANLEWGIEDTFPVCDAADPGRVAFWLQNLSSATGCYEKVALAGRAFAEKYLTSVGAAKKIITALQRPAPDRLSNPATSAKYFLFQHYTMLKKQSKYQELLVSQITSLPRTLKNVFRNFAGKALSLFR